MWYNEKFVYYSNSPGFYAIHFLGKKLFRCYTMYNWGVKIPGKEKKTIIVRNTNLVGCLLDCLFCLSKLLLLLLPWWLSPLSSPLLRRPRACDARLLRSGGIPYIFKACEKKSLCGICPSIWHHSHGQRTGHRPELYASLGTLRIATLLFHRPLLYARPMRRVKI